MQGSIDNIKETTTFLDTSKNIIQASEDVKTFFNLQKFKIPTDTDEIKERAKTNIERFKGNYLLIFLFFSIVFVIKQILVVPIILLWLAYTYLSFKDNIAINGIEIKKEYILITTIILTIGYLIVFNSIISTLLILFSLSMIIIFIHMALYSIEEDTEEEEV